MAATAKPSWKGNITGTSAGVSSGTVKATTLGVGAATPVGSQANIVAPTDLASCIVAITAILAVLDTFGLTL